MLSMAEGRLAHTDARARDAEVEAQALREQLSRALASLQVRAHEFVCVCVGVCMSLCVRVHEFVCVCAGVGACGALAPVCWLLRGVWGLQQQACRGCYGAPGRAIVMAVWQPAGRPTVAALFPSRL